MTKIYEYDSLDILVHVTDEATDAPLDLTGAHIAVRAGRHRGEAVEGAVETPDVPADGNIAISYPPGTFAGRVGHTKCHVRVTRNSITQTVAVIEFDVERAI